MRGSEKKCAGKGRVKKRTEGDYTAEMEGKNARMEEEGRTKVRQEYKEERKDQSVGIKDDIEEERRVNMKERERERERERESCCKKKKLLGRGK